MTSAPAADRVRRPAAQVRRTLLPRAVMRGLARHRRLVTAVLLATAAAAAANAARPARPPSAPVVVAAHDLASGQVLTARDLAVADRPRTALPDGVLVRVPELVGRTVAGPVRRGEVMTDARLVGPALLRGLPGLVAAPVRVADAGSAAMVRVGDHVDVLAAGMAGSSTEPAAAVVADGALVLALPDRPAADAGAGQSLDGSGEGALLLLAVPPESARALASAGAAARLSLVLLRGETQG